MVQTMSDFVRRKSGLQSFMELPLWAQRSFFLCYLTVDITDRPQQTQRRAVMTILAGPKGSEALEKIRSMHIREVEIKDRSAQRLRGNA